MHWLFLILASTCEIFWLYCLRQLNTIEAASLFSFDFINDKNGYITLFAILGYAGFGLANVLFLSMALKKIPAMIGFAVWTAIPLCVTTMVDAYLLNIPFTWEQGIFMVMIGFGILGMKLSARIVTNK